MVRCLIEVDDIFPSRLFLYFCYVSNFVNDWLIVYGIGERGLLPHEGEGVTKFIVTSHHQTPELALQHVLHCERFNFGASAKFIWKVL